MNKKGYDNTYLVQVSNRCRYLLMVEEEFYCQRNSVRQWTTEVWNSLSVQAGHVWSICRKVGAVWLERGVVQRLLRPNEQTTGSLRERGSKGGTFSSVLLNGIYGDANEFAVACPRTSKSPLIYLKDKQSWVLRNEPDITHSSPHILPIKQNNTVKFGLPECSGAAGFGTCQ